ncbi:Crp/Fnr family transcriptional regulator [Microvirga sp. 2YAF29]|uniref:Crp/Fnr family transcriptional regulator n=1 Tax=Microvirga sp. 2YAF29 TaxID=3233031 RepID=UPI003F96B603
MDHPFVRKLRHGARLTREDEVILTRLAQPVRTVSARGDIIPEGSSSRFLPLIVEGWACRYRLLPNGKRQIISLFIPGDLCEPFGVLPRFMDQPLAALTPVTAALVPLSAIGSLVRHNPRINEAFWWDLLVASTIEREHVVSLGRRTATERLGYLFCELHLRLEMVGLVNGLSFDMPVTQADLGDVLGLSTVHVNRSLQELRLTGLISLRGRSLTLQNLEGLRELSFFDADYLHTSILFHSEPMAGRIVDPRE